MVLAAMYIRAVQSLRLVPELLRTDHGNETGVMAAAHCTLRENADAHRYGTSVANQGIENFWSRFPLTFTSWLVNFFKQIVDEGLLELGNYFHMQCIWFCFSDLLQLELDNFAERWNTHHIRSSKPNCIAGVPDQLFTFPEEYGYINCGTRLSLADLDHLKQQIDIQRETELITFDLEDNTVISYCMYIVRQLCESNRSIFKN